MINTKSNLEKERTTVTDQIFEVETRVHFDTPEAAYSQIPFLKSALLHETTWTTVHYGQHLFTTDRLLRIGEVRDNHGQIRYWLGWKGPDQGQFANIREELDEEVTDGIQNSAILNLLKGTPNQPNLRSVEMELEKLNYHHFMKFSGSNRTGFYEPLAIHLKLMFCPVLKWPLIVELEKTATTSTEALEKQDELEQLLKRLDLTGLVIREEPPTLLYESLSSSNRQNP